MLSRHECSYAERSEVIFRMTGRRGFNTAGQLGNDGRAQDRAQDIPAYDRA